MAKTRTRTAQVAGGDETTETTNTSDMVMLKLVGANSYHCHKVRDDVIKRGEILEVSPEIADFLLEDTYTDALNNVHPVFVETSLAEEEAAKKRLARKTKDVPADDSDDE